MIKEGAEFYRIQKMMNRGISMLLSMFEINPDLLALLSQYPTVKRNCSQLNQCNSEVIIQTRQINSLINWCHWLLVFLLEVTSDVNTASVNRGLHCGKN